MNSALQTLSTSVQGPRPSILAPQKAKRGQVFSRLASGWGPEIEPKSPLLAKNESSGAVM